MARLPTVQDLGPRPTPRSQRRVVPIRADIVENAEAAGFRQLAVSAGKVEQTAASFAQGLQRQQLAKARSDFLAGSVALDAEFARDQDFETAEARYAEKLETLTAAASAKLTGSALTAFNQRTAVDIARGTAVRQRDVFGKRQDFNLAELAGTLDTNREAVLRAPDPATRQSLLDATNDSVEAMREQGFLSRVEADKMKREVAQDFATSRVAMQTPAEQVRLLTGEPEGLVKFIPADVRSTMLLRAARLDVILAERTERKADKELKERQSLNSARLTDGILEGRVTDADLDAAREAREIDGSQFIAARKLLKAQESDAAIVDDAITIFDFTTKLDDGELTKSEVEGAFAAKLIKQATMNRFRSEIDSGPDDFKTKEERRALRENVAGASGLGALLNDKQTRKVNDAVDEFNERVRDGKEDPRAVREDIESRAAAPRELSSFIKPRFMVGPDIERIDIEETEKALLRAQRAGKMTRSQFNEQIRILKEIEAALPKERKAGKR